MQTETSSMTLEEYARLDEPDERYVSELVRGVVVREPRPGDVHGSVEARLTAALGVWAKTVGARVTVESGYILSDDPPTLRGTDVAVVLVPRRTENEPGNWVRGAPDVAVEVLSPSDTASAMQEKVLDYLNAGSKLVWLVDPSARTVTVVRPDGSARILREREMLEGEGVLGGFSVGLAELFEDLD